jgi:hypothetical protein
MDETQNLPRRARYDRVVRAPSRPAATSWDSRPVGSDIPRCVLSDSERDRPGSHHTAWRSSTGTRHCNPGTMTRCLSLLDRHLVPA